jgi:hypothetical protein
VAGQLTTYVGLTDRDWFNFLSRRAGLDEVNFWQPRASTTFAALKPGEPFLFTLDSPDRLSSSVADLPMAAVWFRTQVGIRE